MPVITATPTLTSSRTEIPEKTLLAGLALTSFAALLLELALTRLFSVVLFYHFAFLAISIALLGFGCGRRVRLSAEDQAREHRHALAGRAAVHDEFGGSRLSCWKSCCTFRSRCRFPGETSRGSRCSIWPPPFLSS